MQLIPTTSKSNHNNISSSPKKRITLFFSEEEFTNVERTCLYLNSSARPLLKEIVIKEIERLHEQREAHSDF